jgi:hypothetical protein
MPKFINRFLLKNLDCIISSSIEQDDIIRHLGWKKKIYDIKNISDTKRFEKRVNIKKFKLKYTHYTPIIYSNLCTKESLKKHIELL